MRCCRSAKRSARFRNNSTSSWPGLTRPSTFSFQRVPKTWMPGTRPGMTSFVRGGVAPYRQAVLARSTRVLEDRAEQLPALAVELHHLQLLVDAIVLGRGVVDDARQREIELDVLQAGRLLHDVLAGQVVAAGLQHMDQELRGRVAVRVEARVLVAVRIVLRHE